MAASKATDSISTWLQRGILFCVIVILPLAARGQDYQAVGARLQQAVKNGELTQDQADAMMTTLKKVAQTKPDDKAALKRKDAADPRDAITQLKQAVADGKLTKEQALEKLAALKKAQDGRGSQPAKEDLEAAAQKIQEAVKAGKLTKEQALEKLAALKKAQGARSDSQPAKDDLEAAAQKIKEAVKAGKLTKEQAAAKLAELKRAGSGNKPEKQDKDSPTSVKPNEYQALLKKLRAAVESGEITKEEAKAKLKELQKQARPRDKP